VFPQQPTIIYTLTDEAPAAGDGCVPAHHPHLHRAGGHQRDTSDISVAARVLASFPECLSEAQRVPDTLAELGQLTLKPEANIIKLPNISASVAPAQGLHQGTAGQGLRHPRLSREIPRPTRKRPSARATPSASAAP
jgi:isocitrate dehydrogenase